MLTLDIVRRAYMDFGTYGTLHTSEVNLFTCERPWLGNQRSISCIPVGEYACRPRPFFRGGYDAWEVMDVPGRSHILIHIGNTPSDVQGCILVGSAFGYVKGQWAVTGSKQAFGELHRILEGVDEWQLIIRNAEPGGIL